MTERAAHPKRAGYIGVDRRALPELVIAAGVLLSLAAYYLLPSPLLSLPPLVLFAALAWLRLEVVLCLLPVTFPFWYVPKRVTGQVVFPLSEIALAICAACALVQAARHLPALSRHLRRVARAAVLRGGPRLALGGLLLALGSAIGVLIAPRPHEALRAFRWEVAEPLLYFALLVLVVRRPQRAARLLVWAMLGSALLVAALATLQVVWLHVTFAPLAQGGNRLLPFQTAAGGVPRATGIIYGSGNSLGAWLARAIPLALALALPWERDRKRPRWPVDKATGNPERWLAGFAALACVPALLWSASRGAWIACVAGCLVVAVLWLWPLLATRSTGLGSALRWRGWGWGAVALAALAGALGLAFLVLWQPLAALAGALLAGHGGSGEVRVLLWRSALAMLRDHPVFGVGPDQFLSYYSPHYTAHPYWIPSLNGHPTLAAREPDLAQPHNLLLEVWLSGGILAVAGFVLLVVELLRRCLWLVRSGVDWRRAAALGLFGATVAALVHGLVDSAYFAPDLALWFWWALALVVTLARRAGSLSM